MKRDNDRSMRTIPAGPWSCDTVHDGQIRDSEGRLLCVVVPTEISYEEFEAVKALIVAASVAATISTALDRAGYGFAEAVGERG